MLKNDLAAEKRSIQQWCLHALEMTRMIQRSGIIVMREILNVSNNLKLINLSNT